MSGLDIVQNIKSEQHFRVIKEGIKIRYMLPNNMRKTLVCLE